MEFAVFYLKEPVLGGELGRDSHVHVGMLFAENAVEGFEKLRENNVPDTIAGSIGYHGLRRFGALPGDILASDKGDVIRKSSAGLEVVAPSLATLRLLYRCGQRDKELWKRTLERSSFRTVREALLEEVFGEDFPPEEYLPF